MNEQPFATTVERECPWPMPIVSDTLPELSYHEWVTKRGGTCHACGAAV